MASCYRHQAMQNHSVVTWCFSAAMHSYGLCSIVQSPRLNCYLRLYYNIPATNIMTWYQGQKVKKSDASLLARGFLNLGPAKTPKSSHFSQKNERIWGVLGLREHEMRSNPWYHRGQNTFWPQHHDMMDIKKFQNIVTNSLFELYCFLEQKSKTNHK